jgi:hypothetical protein
MRFLQKYVKTSRVHHLAWNENAGRPLVLAFFVVPGGGA